MDFVYLMVLTIYSAPSEQCNVRTFTQHNQFWLVALRTIQAIARLAAIWVGRYYKLANAPNMIKQSPAAWNKIAPQRLSDFCMRMPHTNDKTKTITRNWIICAA